MIPFMAPMMMGQGNAGPFTPARLGPTLRAWHDADDEGSFSFSSVSQVSQWRDKSGYGLHQIQPATVSQPSRITSALGGRAGVQCPEGRFLYSQGDLTFSGNSTRTYILLYRLARSAGQTSPFYSGAEENERAFSLDARAAPGQLVLFRYGNDLSLGAASAGETPIIAAWHDGSNTRAERNGSAVSGIISGATNTTPGKLGLAGTPAGLRAGGNIDLFEVIVCDTALLQAQRDQVVGYLAWKWGLQGSLPAGHAYKNAPPT